jgi:carboxyl-terminal processing protease
VRDNYVNREAIKKQWASWEHRYDGQLKTQEDAGKAIAEMLKVLNDKYTRYLPPQEMSNENAAMDNAKVIGVGIKMSESRKPGSKVMINTVVEDTSAQEAGLAGGDLILSVDNKDVTGMSTEETAALVRGAPNTSVSMTVLRNGERKTVVLTRKEITIHSVSSQILQNNIGYIRLSSFIAINSAAEFQIALVNYRNCDGILLDLRNNPGGLVNNVLSIASAFLKEGTIVETLGPNGKMVNTATGKPLTQKPLVVLVDGESASASEILAGALQDHKRATIVGSKTFGKGLVQEINKLKDGSGLHITVSHYYTPKHRDIHQVGIIPDIVVDGDADKQKECALAALRHQIALEKPVTLISKAKSTSILQAVSK